MCVYGCVLCILKLSAGEEKQLRISLIYGIRLGSIIFKKIVDS